MLAKGKAEKHAEEVEFAKFQAWCDGTRQATTKSIDEAADQITQLSADIAKAESDAEVLAGEIAGLQGEIAKASDEKASAQAVRKKENTDYLAQHQDFSESVDALERAIAVLKSRSADVPQSLAQVQRLPLVPAKAKALVQSFLALHSESAKEAGAPEANAYEFQSGSVVDMLEKLRIRFKDERLALEKAEMNSKANFELLLQQLEDNLKADGAAVSKKTAAKAARLSAAAGWKGDLEVVEKAKTGDEKTLSDTLATCHSNSAEFEQNQVTRAEEVKAIEKAIGILSSESVKGHADTYLPSLLQSKRKASVFAQLRSATQRDVDVRKRASAYLQGRAKDLGSRYLSVMASHVQDDPFAKVKKMIKDLLVKLMEEANEEADHHAYCTSELATNKMTREDKSQEAEKLSAEVDQLSATVVQLATEITELSDAMSELQASRAEATKIRGEEKATNSQTVADAKEAQVAVQKAIQVLRTFYDKDAAEESSLLQAGKKGAASGKVGAGTRRAGHGSEQHGREPYTGMGDDSTGVLGLLDVILSDFARLETETSSAEDMAEAAYEKFMDESAVELAVKETTMEHKEGSKQQTEEMLHSTKKELSLTQEELDAALVYYDKLKVDCVDTNLSYEERVRMRQEEIQSLKEALRILNGEDSLV